MTVDIEEVIRRLVRYLLEGLAIAICVLVIPAKKQDMETVVTLALTGACTFAVLDLFAPVISDSARKGAGFGVGATLSGYNGFGVLL
jgi:hypothetical protein